MMRIWLNLKNYLNLHDLKLIKGGRFHHISNNINKGTSMHRLVNEYKNITNKSFTIAIGDSDNDFEMLNYAAILA